jgi:hypothetical protein
MTQIFIRSVIHFVSVINKNQTQLLSQKRKKRIRKYVQLLFLIVYIIALAFRAEDGVTDRERNLSPVFCVCTEALFNAFLSTQQNLLSF